MPGERLVSPRMSDNATSWNGKNKAALYSSSGGPGPFHHRLACSCPMVRVPRPPTLQSIDLLQQNDQRQVVRKGLWSKGPDNIALLAEVRAMTVGSADHPGNSCLPCTFPLFPILQPLSRAFGLAGFIQANPPTFLGLLLEFRLFFGALWNRKDFNTGKTLDPFHVLGRCFPGPATGTTHGADSVFQELNRRGKPTETEEPSENITESGSVRKMEP